MTPATGYRDVGDYPPALLWREGSGVHVPVTYRQVWEDGFGARGWKLDAAIGDPLIIASTRETGDRIPTSVLVHDTLDHLLSGFGLSGHRAEAMALCQLGLRTGSDIRPDYRQLVMEDLRYGRVNGESLLSFLPDSLRRRLPATGVDDGRRVIATLAGKLGTESLWQHLVARFFELGEQGRPHAERSRQRLGIDSGRCRRIGLALQRLLEWADREVQNNSVVSLRARFFISNERCALNIECDDRTALQRHYETEVV